MKISMSDKKVRATELPIFGQGAKATIIALRRWYNKIRSSFHDTGKTGIDRTANRENKINEARVVRTNSERQIIDEDEMGNIAKENAANELKELEILGSDENRILTI